MSGQISNSCGTSRTPAFMASAGPWLSNRSPWTETCPASGMTRPAATPTRVDLPAPFSPTTASTSPS